MGRWASTEGIPVITVDMDPQLGSTEGIPVIPVITVDTLGSPSESGHAGVGDPLNYSFLPTGSLRLLRGRDKTVSVGKHLTETVLLMKLDEIRFVGFGNALLGSKSVL